MALKLGELVAVLKADDTQFDKALDKAKKRFEGFGDKAKVAGAAIGIALAAGVVGAMDLGGANAKLAAQLGATGPESARLGRIAGDLYAGAYGDSLDQVNGALAGVVRNIKGIGEASDEALSSAAADALNLATVMDEDVGRVTASVGQMLKTGLARNAQEAFDILTRGVQTGADKAEDLLDTFNEYSTKFRDIGLSGKQAMGLLSQGLQAGARDADTVADALKEFAIRAIDGSATTKQGFDALGLSGKKMAADIAAGGPRAAAALDLTLDRLRGIKDPVERNAAAVALFGTKAEDLGDALFSLDPSSAVDALGKVDGAAKDMGDTLSDTAQSKLESFKRKAHQALVQKMGEAIPTIEKVVGWLDKHSAVVGPLAVTLGVLAGAIYGIVTAVKIWTAVQTVLNVVLALNPIGLVVLAIAALVAGIILAYQHSETFRRIVSTGWDYIKIAVLSAVLFILRWYGALLTGAANAFGWIPGIGPKLKAAQAKFEEFADKVDAAIQGIKNKTVKITVEEHVKMFGKPGTSTGGIGGSGFKGFAAGGDVAAGVPIVVGEKGWELFVPKVAGTIVPHDQAATAARTGGAAGGGLVELLLRGEFRISGNDLVVLLRERIAVRGGVVQAVLGAK